MTTVALFPSAPGRSQNSLRRSYSGRFPDPVAWNECRKFQRTTTFLGVRERQEGTYRKKFPRAEKGPVSKRTGQTLFQH